MDQNPQGSASTGTRDETYNLVAVLYHALQGVENCQTYAQDVQGSGELRQFFEQAGQQQRQLADQAKQLLQNQLSRSGQPGGSGEGSAFNQFGSSSSGSSDFASSQGQQGGSAYASGINPNASGNDPSTQFGQSATGQGQRHNEMNTGGGGTSSF